MDLDAFGGFICTIGRLKLFRRPSATDHDMVRYRRRTFYNSIIEARGVRITLRQILLKPLDSLFARIIHGFFVLLATPITSQRKPVDLIFINLSVRVSQILSHQTTRKRGIIGAYPNLMGNVRFLCQAVLNLPNTGHIQQTILCSQCQA